MSRDDKRRAEWTLTPEFVGEMQSCFRSDAALIRAVDTNTNTWRKIADGGFVKKSVAKEIAEEFIAFLHGYLSGEVPPDSSKYYERPIPGLASKYGGDANCDDLLVKAE